jgi:hypothetical protein
MRSVLQDFTAVRSDLFRKGKTWQPECVHKLPSTALDCRTLNLKKLHCFFRNSGSGELLDGPAHKTKSVIEVVTTFSAFRFPELSQSIWSFLFSATPT